MALKQTTVYKNGRYELDEMNYRILDELNENARISTVDLSRKMGIGRASVKTRVKELEEVGIIEGYTVMINWDLIDGGK